MFFVVPFDFDYCLRYECLVYFNSETWYNARFLSIQIDTENEKLLVFIWFVFHRNFYVYINRKQMHLFFSRRLYHCLVIFHSRNHFLTDNGLVCFLALSKADIPFSSLIQNKNNKHYQTNLSNMCSLKKSSQFESKEVFWVKTYQASYTSDL